MSAPDDEAVLASTSMTPPQRSAQWSAFWTALLIPFIFLPYRFLWLPCALGGMALVGGRGDLRTVLRIHGTVIIGAPLVLILRTALDPEWWGPWIVLLGVLAWLRPRLLRWRLLLLPAIAIAAILLLARPQVFAGHAVGPLDESDVLVCAGDSLTSGVTPGSDDGTYVASLRKRFPCPVINAGVANDKTRDLLRRLDRDVITKKPTTVLLFIGGNDSLDGTPRGDFARHLDEAAGRIARAGARLVIVEVPAGIVWNSYAGLYRRTARRYGAELVPESRLRLWFTAELLARDRLPEPLTIDGIHLSEEGAVRVAEWLEPYLRGD